MITRTKSSKNRKNIAMITRTKSGYIAVITRTNRKNGALITRTKSGNTKRNTIRNTEEGVTRKIHHIELLYFYAPELT